MNLVLMDTGRESARETAQWFLRQGHSVRAFSRHDIAWPGVRAEKINFLDAQAIKRALADARVDALVLGAEDLCPDGEIGAGHDSAKMLDAVIDNLRGALNLVEACVPCMADGLRRIACVTTVESSNSWCRENDHVSYHQALSGMNMMGKLLFNQLRPKGFTFRWYCEGARGGMCAGEYILSQLCYDEQEPYMHSDENRLTLRDGWLREISW